MKTTKKKPRKKFVPNEKFIAELDKTGLNQKEFAILIDRDHQTVSNYACGRTPVSQLVWDKLKSIQAFSTEALKRQVGKRLADLSAA